MPQIKAHWNCDHTFVVWSYEDRIDGCRGFALWRRAGDAEPEPVHTWVGWDNRIADVQSVTKSTEWPIQRYTWADFQLAPGRTVSYQAVPLLGTAHHFEPDDDRATPWSDPVTVTASAQDGMEAYFNRGIVSTQWLSRALGGTDEDSLTETLETVIETKGDPTRDKLGGELKRALLDVLDDAVANGKTVYAALFELDDPELLEKLCALGARARVVLANGSTKHVGDDENKAARDTLNGAGVEVHDRMLHSRHLGHNKFAVVCDGAGENPERVWTGSTNWTKKGLCTQANNALVVADAPVAGLYRDQWDRLRDAGDDQPQDLKDHDDKGNRATLGSSALSLWFTPVEDFVDLEEAAELINGANDGILFLMFNPGPRGTLLDDIIERNSPASPHYDENLYVHGVLSQDPYRVTLRKGESPDDQYDPLVALFRRGRFEATDFDIVLPANIDQRLDYWTPELKKAKNAHAIVHSKTIVLDPFGDKPVVMTGSHNMGPKASGQNDENLAIVTGSHTLAAAYAVNIIGIYTQYRWRFLRQQRERKFARPQGDNGAADTAARNGASDDEWQGLQDNDTWQDRFLTGARMRELRFWLGERVAAPAAPAPSTG